MPSTILNLHVRIVRFVDAHQPGWVACEFVDAENRSHTVVDKVPIFTADDIDQNTKFPLPGIMQCELISQLRDANGRDLVRISTERPSNIASEDGLSEFTVLSSQLGD